MAVVRLACHAMATRFELLLVGTDEARLRAAGEEAVATIHRLESQLSRFRPTSDIGRINARAAYEAVPVDPALFRLLQRARSLHAATDGMFDITVAPLMRCWRFRDCIGAASHAARPGTVDRAAADPDAVDRDPAELAATEPGAAEPDATELDAARQRVGLQHMELDSVAHTVRFARPGVELDLGGVGKGYALDCAAAVLREAGVEHALLHGGTSSVYGIGSPGGGRAWKVAIEHPHAGLSPQQLAVAPLAMEPLAVEPLAVEPLAVEPLAVVPLRDRALSVSAVWGRTLRGGGEVYGHVMDPSLGRPVRRAVLAAAVCDSATDADAMATGLLALGTAGARACLARLPGTAGLVIAADDADDADDADERRLFRQGIEILPARRGLARVS
jgi:FAD:protein FMN transferase